MKFCSKCGSLISDGNQQFCGRCGTPTSGNQAPSDQSAVYQAPTESIEQFSMKWYKFLIYFLLFADAVLNLIIGFNILFGNPYAPADPSLVYTLYDGLRVIDSIYGVVLICLAGFSIFTRFALSSYKAIAPKCVCILYALGTIVPLIYTLNVAAVTNIDGLFTSSTVTSIVSSVVITILNYIYFKKRAVLFKN